MMSHRWMLGALLAALTVATPAWAQEATPQSGPAEPITPEVQPSSMPAADTALPAATDGQIASAPIPPAETPAAKPAVEGPKRRFGYLAVFGMASLAAGAGSLILAGASLLNPYAVLAGLNFIQRDTDGLTIPGTGTSINPFYALGGVLLVVGLAFGAAGITMLGLEVYFNGSF